MTDSISFDLYKLNKNNGVSEVKDTEKTDEINKENKTSNPITIPIGESTENKSADVSQFFDKKTLEKFDKYKLKFPKIQVTKEEIQKAENFLLTKSKELGIDINVDSLSKEEKALYVALSLAYQKGKLSKEEFIDIMRKYGNEEVVNAIRDAYPDDTTEIDPKRQEVIKKKLKRFANLLAVSDLTIAQHIYGDSPEATKRLREEYLLKAAERNETDHKLLANKIKNDLKKDYNEDFIKDVVSSTIEFAEEYSSNIVKLAEKNGYEKSFVQKLTQITIRNVIRIYGKLMFDKFLEKRADYKEKILNAEEKKEEAAKAEKEAQKAQEEANKMKATADAMLNKYHADELPDAQQEKVLMKISPTAALRKSWADADLKKAKEVAYDAQSEKRLAIAFAEIAAKSMSNLLALAQAHMQVIMQFARMN